MLKQQVLNVESTSYGSGARVAHPASGSLVYVRRRDVNRKWSAFLPKDCSCRNGCSLDLCDTGESVCSISNIECEATMCLCGFRLRSGRADA